MTALLLLAAAVFTGNDSCRPCHATIVKMYERTPMARSTGAITNNVPPGKFNHAASGLEYVITRNGQVKTQRSQHQFDFFIGSGAAGFSYLIFRDRFLFQAPVTWYSQKKRWDASPGYQDDPVMAWDRPIDPSCLSCHASQLTHIYNTVNRYAEKPFEQAGIACERCHGPGSGHIKGQAKMINPAKLDPERRDDVCRQCHLMGEARIERPGRTFAQFRAGARLGDFVAYFVADDPNGPALRTTSHVENMNASQCKQASGDKMWCGTCHDTHTMPVNPVAWFRAKCEACHGKRASGCPRSANCIGCHMPKSQAVDAGHGAFTDHSIPRRPKVKPPGPKPWRLKPFSPSDAGALEHGLAYIQVYERTKDDRQKQEAKRLLTR
jgi:hypothetical protein